MTDLDVLTLEPYPGTSRPVGADRRVGVEEASLPPLVASDEDGPEVDWERLAPTGWYARRGKRLFDLALLAVALPLAIVPFVAVALANLVAHRDPRRIFFTQARVGRRGREFVIVKFRTMCDAPRGQMESWTSGTDAARVTRWGRFLRNTHLDELPQLVNVLRGDMQFIGPRPEMAQVEEWAAAEVPGFGERLVVRPGITGLAQITQGYAGCDRRAYAQKLRINRLYLRRLSFRLDFAIVLRTVAWVLRGKGSRWNRAAAARPCLRPDEAMTNAG